jgi:Carbohydrate-binding module 48 (Isoamylase N-terminal domain)
MENAGEITLIGSWNGWDSEAHKLHRWGSYYWLDVDLEPGRYEYTFKNQTGRFLPLTAREKIDDGFGGVNAVAVIE